MMKKVFFIVVVIITASVFLCVYHLNHRMLGYDNLVKKEDVITQQYPPEMVDELTEKMAQKEVTPQSMVF